MTPYEAWCPRCRVTHPPETRVCIHCGGRVARDRGAAESPPTRFGPPGAREEPPDAEAEVPEQAQAARPLRVALAVLWVLLAIAGTLWQRCHHPP